MILNPAIFLYLSFSALSSSRTRYGMTATEGGNAIVLSGTILAQLSTDSPFKKAMKEINQTTLLYLAGDAAYRRGEAYYQNEQVGELRIKGNTITAEVTGTEIYLVRLKHTAKIFEGSCDCPASDNFDFCKHCVATGLKYLQQQNIKEQLYDSHADDLLRNYLLGLEKPELAEQLEMLITDDKLLHDKWMLKAEVAAGKLDHKAFKKRITRAIPYNRHLYRYVQVRTYFAGVELLVDKLAELLPEFKADEALTLIDYALQRINKALESVDDSGGFRYYSVETLNELHIETLARLQWTAEKIANYLLGIYTSPANEIYPPIPESYLSILTDEGLNYFTADLQSRWDKLPPLTGKVDWDMQYKYLELQRPLLVAAEARDDVDTQIKLLAKTAIESHKLLALSELCLKHDRLDEAIDWFKQALQQEQREENRFPNFSLTEQEIAILCYQKKFGQALQVRWTNYQQHPSMENYRKVCEMAKQADDNSDWYQRAIDYLQSMNKSENNQHNYDLIAELYLNQQHRNLALKLAQQHRLDREILYQVIRANIDKPDQILPLFVRLAEFEVIQGNNDAYHKAIALLQEAEKIMNNTQHKILFKEIVRLHKQYKQKRNFKKWLEEAFPVLVENE